MTHCSRKGSGMMIGLGYITEGMMIGLGYITELSVGFMLGQPRKLVTQPLWIASRVKITIVV